MHIRPLATAQRPETIHDFYGFPEALYHVEFPAPGTPRLARQVAALAGMDVAEDPDHGLDHGAWSVLHFMYPAADIPVCQLSVNVENTPEESYETGRLLRVLREDGILILGSSNIIHNLSQVAWDMPAGGYPWADAFDGYIRDVVTAGRHEAAVHFEAAGPAARRAFVYRDHYDQLLYALGATENGEKVQVFNEERVVYQRRVAAGRGPSGPGGRQRRAGLRLPAF